MRKPHYCFPTWMGFGYSGHILSHAFLFGSMKSMCESTACKLWTNETYDPELPEMWEHNWGEKSKKYVWNVLLLKHSYNSRLKKCLDT